MLINTKILVYFKDRHRGMLLGLLFATFIVYIPYINNTLFFDDLPFFSSAVSHYVTLSSVLELRWLSYASLGWTWQLFTDTPLPLHLGNLLLHAANTLLVFVLLQQLMELSLKKDDSHVVRSSFFSSPANWGAWLGALCFACHPVAVYAVGYIVQRSTLMATLFILSMQLTYLRGLINPQKFQQYVHLALAVLFYFFAVFSKEHSLMAPALLAAITLLFKPHIRPNWRALIVTWLSFIAIAILITLKAKGVFATAYEQDSTALFEQQAIVSSAENLHLLSMFTQAGLFFKYLFLWLIPNPAWMSIDMRETFANSVSAWQNWLKVTCFIAYGVFALKLLLRRGKVGLIGFALLYPWLLFMIEFSSIRVQEPFVLYRSYLWMPGFMLFIPLALQTLPNKKGVIAAFTFVILLLIPISWNRLWVFADSYRLWNDAAVLLKSDFVPGAARIFYNRGNAELNTKKTKEAIADFKRVLAIDPKIEQAHANLGSAYLNTGQYALGLASVNRAIEINPENGQTYFAKAFALKHLNNPIEAMEALNKSCELKNISACLIIALTQKK